MLASVFFAHAATGAPSPKVRLVYERGPGAETCPDDEQIRAGVVSRIGYDPFDAGAMTTIHASVVRDSGGLAARIDVRADDGAVRAERRLSSEVLDCSELAASLELAMSIAIDPRTGMRPPSQAPISVPPAPPPVVLSPPPAVAAVEAPSPKPVPSPPLAVLASASAIGSIGATPSTTMGIVAQLGVRRGPWSIRVEGLADVPSSTDLPAGGSVLASRVAGLGLLCAHASVFVGCVLGGGGVLHAEGRGVVDAKQASSPYVPVGARASVEIPLTSSVFVRAGADLLFPLTRTTYNVSPVAVWVSPSVSGALGAGAGVRFP